MFCFCFVFTIFVLTVLSSKRGGAKTFHPVVVLLHSLSLLGLAFFLHSRCFIFLCHKVHTLQFMNRTVQRSPISELPNIRTLSTSLILQHSTARVILLLKGKASLARNTSKRVRYL